eukprot:m.282954 g.282954  ORF g.282954 m.282954 type:complete len:423 (+) comp17755_c0_seq3:177-1445(+)
MASAKAKRIGNDVQSIKDIKILQSDGKSKSCSFRLNAHGMGVELDIGKRRISLLDRCLAVAPVNANHVLVVGSVVIVQRFDARYGRSSVHSFACCSARFATILGLDAKQDVRVQLQSGVDQPQRELKKIELSVPWRDIALTGPASEDVFAFFILLKPESSTAPPECLAFSAPSLGTLCHVVWQCNALVFGAPPQPLPGHCFDRAFTPQPATPQPQPFPAGSTEPIKPDTTTQGQQTASLLAPARDVSSSSQSASSNSKGSHLAASSHTYTTDSLSLSHYACLSPTTLSGATDNSATTLALTNRIKRLLHHDLGYSQTCKLLCTAEVPVKTAVLQVRQVADTPTLILSYRASLSHPPNLLHHATAVRFEQGTSCTLEDQIDSLALWLSRSLQSRSKAIDFNGWLRYEDGLVTILPITSLGTAV